MNTPCCEKLAFTLWPIIPPSMRLASMHPAIGLTLLSSRLIAFPGISNRKLVDVLPNTVRAESSTGSKVCLSLNNAVLISVVPLCAEGKGNRGVRHANFAFRRRPTDGETQWRPGPSQELGASIRTGLLLAMLLTRMRFAGRVVKTHAAP